MVGSNSNDIYNSYMTKAITDIRSNRKRPDEEEITDYVIQDFATNIDESFIEKIIKKLLDQNLLENMLSCKGNSFFIVPKENSEDRMNPEVLTSQTPMPQWLLLKPGPGPWTLTQKSLDPEKPGPWKTWTQKNLDPEKPGPRKTWTLKNLGS